MEADKVATFLERMAKFANKKGFKLILFLLGLACTLTVWESRGLIVQRINNATSDKAIQTVLLPPLLTSVSAATQKKIDSFTHQDNYVGLTIVFGVDVVAESRTNLYRTISDSKVAAIIAEQDKRKNRELLMPLYSDNALWNQQMRAIRNGEFRCGDPEDSGIFNAYPNLRGVLKTVCRIPIPPGWSGSLAGYIAFYSTEKMSQDQVDTLRLKARFLSTEIWNADVKQEPVQFDRK